MIVVTRYFPVHQRGRLLGVIASTVAFAAGTGPILGGFISGTFHWRYLFLTPLITIFAIPFLLRFLPDEKNHKRKFDTSGAFLLGSGTAALLLFVTRGDWWTLPSSIFILIWFVLHIRRIEDPFVSPNLFQMRPYRNTVITTFLSIGTVFGMMFLVPIMLSDLNGLDANRIGLAMFPGAICAALLGTYGGRLSDRKGSRFVVYLGSGLLIGGFFLLSTFTGQATWIISLNLIICYTGYAFLQSSLPHSVSATLPMKHTGIGMGIYNLLFFISGAFSNAGIGRLLDFRSAGFSINPLTSSVSGWIYSNIIMMLAVVVTISAVIFHLTFRREVYLR
jgi:DHA2 family metal-tetracycline-proton antiporter-like MFS transporter